MPRICKNGREIRSVDDWFDLAPPQGGIEQWVDGRNAKELAKAWFPASGSPHMPPEFRSLLDRREETRGAALDEGEPERVIAFDDCGEGAHADLVLWGSAPHGRMVGSIEAKADESFGGITGVYVDSSAARNPRSRLPERLGLLCRGVLGVGPDDERARALRYQLLTGVAGALVEAHKCNAEIVLFIVHEFLGMTDDARVKANAEDLNGFVRLLSRGRTRSVPPGELLGPFSVPGNRHFPATERLFVGKCRRLV